MSSAKSLYLCTRKTKTSLLEDPLAQLVEHNTFNVGVLGSSPKRITPRKEAYRRISLFFVYALIFITIYVTLRFVRSTSFLTNQVRMIREPTTNKQTADIGI